LVNPDPYNGILLVDGVAALRAEKKCQYEVLLETSVHIVVCSECDEGGLISADFDNRSYISHYHPLFYTIIYI